MISDSFGGRPIFTLKHDDWDIKPESRFYRPEGINKLRSFQQLYLSYSDPSEYSFALGVLGSWDHWLKLSGSKFFTKELASLRATLATKIDSETILAAQRQVKSGVGPQSLQAAKWLSERVNGSGSQKAKRGRPSKDEVEGELKRQAEEQDDLDNDLTRLGL